MSRTLCDCMIHSVKFGINIAISIVAIVYNSWGVREHVTSCESLTTMHSTFIGNILFIGIKTLFTCYFTFLNKYFRAKSVNGVIKNAYKWLIGIFMGWTIAVSLLYLTMAEECKEGEIYRYTTIVSILNWLSVVAYFLAVMDNFCYSKTTTIIEEPPIFPRNNNQTPLNTDPPNTGQDDTVIDVNNQNER